MRPGLPIWLGITLLAMAAFTGCPGNTVAKSQLGKGGLPTNNMEGLHAEGTAGTAMTVPPELLYPGAKEIKGRPFFYQTNVSADTAMAWCKEHIAGATEIEVAKAFKTLQGTEWTVDIYNEAGGAVIKYTNNKYRAQ